MQERPVPPDSSHDLSPFRAGAAVAIALLGSVAVWVAVPYNNFRLNNTYVADSYLPEIVVAFILLLIAGVNPLVRRLNPRWMLNRRQIALVVGLLLLATVIPSNGLMRMFPRLVAQSSHDFNANPTTARVAATAGFRQALFPDALPVETAPGTQSAKVHTPDTPVADGFLGLQRDEGQRIPWNAWWVPMASWGMLILAMWAMMIGLGGIVYPQWRDRERLPFPLLTVYQSLVGDSDEKPRRVLPDIFYSRLFWIGCGTVFVIHAFRGLNVFTHAFPSFPLSWNLSAYFSDGILRDAPATLKNQSILFTVVGVAYFIPSRYAVSVWGWVLLYSCYLTFGQAYIPAFDGGQVNDQTFGALLAIAVWVLWMGRAHWAKVGRAMFGRAHDREEGRRDAVAGWLFAIGCAGIVLWLYWAGCKLWWSLLATAGCALTTLVMARLVAETGVSMLWTSRIGVSQLTAFLPLQWLSPQILFFQGVFYALLTRTTAVSAGVMATLALGADAKATPAQHRRLMVGGLSLMAAGFVICGAVHLNMGYRSAEITTQAKTGGTVINAWTSRDRVNYEAFGTDRKHQIAGFGMGMGLLWACSRFPAWPLHPAGLVFCPGGGGSMGMLVWFSVFLGWLIKTLLTRLFGAGAYRNARPLFLGLIMGELLAIVVWTLVPVIIIWATGADPAEVQRYTVFRYG